MESELNKPNYVGKMQVEALKVLRELDDRLVYHNSGFYIRLSKHIHVVAEANDLSETEIEILDVAAWLSSIVNNTILPEEFQTQLSEDIVKQRVDLGEKYLQQINYPEQRVKRVIDVIKAQLPDLPDDTLVRVFADSHMRDIAIGGRDHVKSYYEELLLLNIGLSRQSWYDTVLAILDDYNCQTPYGEREIIPKIKLMLDELRAEKKELEKQERNALKKELNISSKELKTLKNDLLKVKGRDDKGVQTMFRTLSKNHYTLNEMVDRKANIMITVNSIILSLVIGGVIGQNMPDNKTALLSIVVLSLSCIFSVIFAVLAIRPNQTQGEFNEGQIRSKKGNPLYFGNFHNMGERDYEWAMFQVMNDSEYLYSAMIRDVYHLGNSIFKKHKKIRFSLNIFIAGFLVSLLLALFNIFREVIA